MHDLSRRATLRGASSLALAGLAPGRAWSESEDDQGSLRGQALHEALIRADRTLFPDKRAMIAGAVLGGLVAFAITRNPWALIGGIVGGAVVGGVASAAVRYIEERSAETGSSTPALQNATLGDCRADTRNTGPYVRLIDERHAEIAPPLAVSLATLDRYSANRQPGPIPDDARQAIIGIVTAAKAADQGLTELAGFVAKHRDVGAVYRAIAPGVGLTQDDRILSKIHIMGDRARRQIDAISKSAQIIESIMRSADQIIGP